MSETYGIVLHLPADPSGMEKFALELNEALRPEMRTGLLADAAKYADGKHIVRCIFQIGPDTPAAYKVEDFLLTPPPQTP